MSRLGKELIGGLRELSDSLKRKESAGGGSDKFTCHTIVLDFQPTQYDAASVKKVRKLLGASQSIFARFLGVTAKTVQSWEQGQSTPSDMACRFLDEIRAAPEFLSPLIPHEVHREENGDRFQCVHGTGGSQVDEASPQL